MSFIVLNLEKYTSLVLEYNEKTPRKHSMHGKIAALILLKLFIAWAKLYFERKHHTIHDTWGPEKYNLTGAVTKSLYCQLYIVKTYLIGLVLST